ncbi:MAG: LPS assembly lipoprotein LptE [Gammaproteobacteria bacterium]|nr:LPS assembly lipoprotein LptE [Gammaproteobacteria bacterium]
MTRILKHIITPALLLTLLTGCGFQLRGNIDIPQEWLALHLVTSSPNGELAKGVRSSLSNNGVQWLAANEANYVLQLGAEKYERRNLSIGANARAAEFELTLSTTLQVRNAKGEVVVPQSDLVVHKIMTHDPDNVTGKVEESNLLRREMRQELVQQLMRNIRFAATSGVAKAN